MMLFYGLYFYKPCSITLLFTLSYLLIIHVFIIFRSIFLFYDLYTFFLIRF